MKKTYAAYFAVVVAVIACGLPAQQASREKVTFDPPSTISVRKGQSTPARFVFHVTPGFHINSHNPTMPELIPTIIHFSLPDDVVIGRVQYPAGQLMSFPFDPREKLSVYSGDVAISGRVVAPPNASTGTYTIHGDLRYQACDNNSCYPPKSLPITFTVAVGAGLKSTKRARPNAQSPHIHN
jgi:Disulphide bond corrector protein DsbC